MNTSGTLGLKPNVNVLYHRVGNCWCLCCCRRRPLSVLCFELCSFDRLARVGLFPRALRFGAQSSSSSCCFPTPATHVLHLEQYPTDKSRLPGCSQCGAVLEEILHEKVVPACTAKRAACSGDQVSATAPAPGWSDAILFRMLGPRRLAATPVNTRNGYSGPLRIPRECIHPPGILAPDSNIV